MDEHDKLSAVVLNHWSNFTEFFEGSSHLVLIIRLEVVADVYFPKATSSFCNGVLQVARHRTSARKHLVSVEIFLMDFPKTSAFQKKKSQKTGHMHLVSPSVCVIGQVIMCKILSNIVFCMNYFLRDVS